MENHPEFIDPTWFQELVRRAFDRYVIKLMTAGFDEDGAYERAMWYVFNIRNSLTDLYEAGKPEVGWEERGY